MPIVPIREDNAYVGIAKQSSQGSPVAPSTFVRWLDGTKLEFGMKTAEVWEGDGSRHVSQLIKEQQMVKVTVKFNPRPIELGFFEAAALGSNSDTFTGATVSTTVSANTSSGASTITVPVNTGLTGTGTINLVVGAGTANEEIATFNLPVTGVGPYTLTVANSGTLKKSHTTSDVIRTYSQHVLTDQVDSPYYTLEVGLGSLNSGAGPTLRVTDCKVEQIQRSAKAGGILEYSVDFVGIATVAQTNPSVVTYENHNIFLYSQSNGGWTLNGSTTGDAQAVEQFSITQKNAIDTGIQAEALTLAALIFGNVDIKTNCEVIMQNSNMINLTYFGSTTGTTDSQTIGAGNLTVSFTQADGFHVVTYTVTTLNYAQLKMPEPKKDGKHYKFSLEGTSTSNMGQNAYLLQVTVLNTQNSTY